MFLDAHGDWEKLRTWSDDTTHTIHEDQTLRIELIHEAPADETAWTVAVYKTPVSDRMWILTATGGTPAPVLQELLNHLADGWDTAIGAPVDEDRHRRHATPQRRLVKTYRGRATDPLDIPHRGRRSPVRCLHRPAPEPETRDLDHLCWPKPRPSHLDHHRVPAHPEFAARRPLREPRPQIRRPPPTDRGPRTHNKRPTAGDQASRLSSAVPPPVPGTTSMPNAAVASWHICGP